MSESSAASVGLVIDPDFGERIGELAKTMPVWVLSSTVNDPAIEAARLAVGHGRITKLLALAVESIDDLLGRAMCAIDEHHGEDSGACAYRNLLVFGAVRSPPQELASNLGFRSVTATADGFRAEK